MIQGFIDFAIESSLFFARNLNSMWAMLSAGIFTTVKMKGFKTCPKCHIDPFGICEFHDKGGKE